MAQSRFSEVPRRFEEHRKLAKFTFQRPHDGCGPQRLRLLSGLTFAPYVVLPQLANLSWLKFFFFFFFLADFVCLALLLYWPFC